MNTKWAHCIRRRTFSFDATFFRFSDEHCRESEMNAHCTMHIPTRNRQATQRKRRQLRWWASEKPRHISSTNNELRSQWSTTVSNHCHKWKNTYCTKFLHFWFFCRGWGKIYSILSECKICQATIVRRWSHSLLFDCIVKCMNDFVRWAKAPRQNRSFHDRIHSQWRKDAYVVWWLSALPLIPFDFYCDVVWWDWRCIHFMVHNMHKIVVCFTTK